VATYLEEAPADRRECLNAVRDICREVLGDHNEGMDYGMPSYRRDGEVEVAFASQKNYISLYILKARLPTACSGPNFPRPSR